MTDQKLLGMFIQERINMLINAFHKSQPDKSEQEAERGLQAEILIYNLPDKENQMVENYIDSLIIQFSLEEAFLYQHEFMNGMKLIKFIHQV